MKNNSLFKFKQFDIQQNEAVFKVGTDAVLLGCLIDLKNAKFCLEIGTGTGIVSLILAQRFQDSEFLGIDCEQNAVELTDLNFKNSPFTSRLTILKSTVQELENDEKFDFIFCNPPYFKVNTKFIHTKHETARSQTKLTYDDLIKNIKKSLNLTGKSAIIFPFDDLEWIKNLLKKYDFFINQIWSIYGIENGVVKRIIVEFSFVENQIREYEFIIESFPREYSKQYIELTKEFHINF